MSTVTVPVHIGRNRSLRYMPVCLWAIPGIPQSPNDNRLKSNSAAIRFDTIRNAVAAQMNVTVEEMMNRSRERRLVVARQLCMYIMAKKTRVTLCDIGAFLGKDHTTVIYGVRTIEALMVNDPQLCETVNTLLQSI